MASTGHSNERTAYLQSLRQSRRFLDKPVPQSIIDALLEVARTSGNTKSVSSRRFMVVDDLVTKIALSEAGAFSGFLAQVAVAIVIVVDGESTPSKANDESRVADRIMLAAGSHGLGSGTGWFGAGDAQRQAQDILGLPANRYVHAVVGIGYVDEASPGESTSLQRAQESLDALAGDRQPPDEQG
jgi:nitroreductase